MENHVELFVGTPTTALAVKNLLELNNIEFVERNDINSAIAAGFGMADKATHIFVEEHDLEKAKELLAKNDLFND